MNYTRLWMAASIVALAGCGSQQLRLTSPDTKAGVRYTCTSADSCYPASTSPATETAADQALLVPMPLECHGRIQEILIREPDSSSPEIDVTCGVE